MRGQWAGIGYRARGLPLAARRSPLAALRPDQDGRLKVGLTKIPRRELCVVISLCAALHASPSMMIAQLS